MALASIGKANHVVTNLAFVLLLGFFSFFYLLSSPIKSDSVASPSPATIFRLGSSSPTDPDNCRVTEELKVSETKCSYLKFHEPCETSGYIDYLNLFYCVLGDYPALAFVLLALWLLVLFYVLGNTASHYFCPSLESLSKELKLSPTIAGATLLSLGNGAPDVFSSIVSFAGGGVAEVGLSSVLGGAFFVSSAVVGVISLCIGGSSRRPVVLDRVGFIRDLSFLIVVLSFLLLLLHIGQINLLGSMLYTSLYILYVIIISTTHYCTTKTGETSMPLLDSIAVEPPNEELEANAVFESKPTFLISEPHLSFYLGWILFLIELPLYLPRRLTIPIATEERWSKPFAVASVALSPILLATLWSSKTGDLGSEETTTVFLFALIVGVLLGITAMETTDSHPPQLLLPWLAGGFLMSVVWSYIVAGELVSLLVSIGHILGVSPSVLGVTVLAWGNSLGDLIANVAMAVNRGEDGAQIAIAGCYAGPIFNSLVGLGLSLVLSSWATHPSAFVIPEDPSQVVIIWFLIGGLLWALAMLPARGMKLSRVLGIGLLAIYSCFLCLRLLESTGLVQFGLY
ncbi:hypothetical protein HPP92_012144 [Vanilla planifolia]|uniref:Sodium/calcium exchanger membrane region domain-containing protein n=1 Tax=Vanilla planifolia TaxID=51239 RepID=A0A835V328_VANPL|nr:hypothetical protein HPP92_012144 [Vanilla planifolia]